MRSFWASLRPPSFWPRSRALTQSPPLVGVSLLVTLLLLITSAVSLALAADAVRQKQARTVYREVVAPRAPTATLPPTYTPIPAPTPTTPTIPVSFAPRSFEAGMAYPRWGTAGYGPNDQPWQTKLPKLQQQSGAQWIEMVVNLYQATPNSLSVYASSATPSPESLAAGIRQARGMGLHVFVAPFVGVLHGDPWSGSIWFASGAARRTWFASYWRALRPYAIAAAQAGAEQFAIATEFSALELANASYWNTLIANVHTVFPGKLTYDLNFSTLGREPSPWMRNAALAYIGVSQYQSLVASPRRLSAEQIAQAWQREVIGRLETLSRAVGKPVLITEVGYRNAADALYRPWIHTSASPADPALQAAAYEGALRAVYVSLAIAGIYFWAWSVPPFQPDDLPAAQTLLRYYGAIKPQVGG